jgi:predicted esterase
MQEHSLTFDFKARYYTLGEISNSTRQIWFVLHGYGQLARYFIRKFTILTEQHIYVIAPEGLSRFYLESIQSTGRVNDRVGASWMTKENRTGDIENYLQYLNVLAESQIAKDNQIPVTLLGFSQGAATASRWAASRDIKFQRLILWAGIFPPDMNLESGKAALQEKEILLVHGKSDPFLNDARFAEMNTISSSLGIAPQVISFDGGHEIEEKTLLKIV